MSQDSENSVGTEVGEMDLSAFKDNLAEPRFRIRLDDQVNTAVRAALAQMSGETFPLSTPTVTGKDFVDRLAGYEGAVRPLQAMAALLGKWATPEQLPTLTSMVARISEHGAAMHHGRSLGLDLRLYPLSLLLYSAGIASLAAENYRAFAAAHMKRIDARARRVGNNAVVVVPVVDAMMEVAHTNVWRNVDEYRQTRVPESEYLFKTLRPVLDGLLFLGTSYEHLFDQYEILRALIYADATDGDWGPVGRFGWKYSRSREDNPYVTLCADAAAQKNTWGPLQTGLFRGSYARFNDVATRFEKELLQRL